MKYEINFSSQFKKDLKKANKQHKNTDELFDVISTIADGIELNIKYKDHNLVGDYSDYRECHIEPDFILIYRIYSEDALLMLFRIGSHSNLFK